MTRVTVAIASLISIACGAPPLRMPMRSPNPNGCYVMVFEGRGFESSADVLNGPNRWSSLDGLKETNHPRWNDRIRSLRVGSTATVTAFTESRFRGSAERYQPGSEHGDLTPEISAKIESLEIVCTRPPAADR